MKKLEELCELYDLTAEKCDDIYINEIHAAEIALIDKAPEEYNTLLYWQRQREEFKKVTDETLKELEPGIKHLVIQLGRTFKSRLHTWVWAKGRESWKNDVVRGFLLAHHANVEDFMEKGEPTVSKRRNKVDKES